MNVLSLFDGISAGQLALNQFGIEPQKYFASEVDKFAMKVTQHHFPSTIQLGDVKGVGGSILPDIDILFAGFPCPSFSNAGKRKGFDDDRGQLFFEAVRILKETKPKYFLFENVKMKKEYRDRISEELGVEPTLINSALVSAQNRERNYWVGRLNDDGDYETVKIPQPEDKGIVLKDILECGCNRFKTNPIKPDSKTLDINCLDCGKKFKGGRIKEYWGEKENSIFVGTGDVAGSDKYKQLSYLSSINTKSQTLTTMVGGNREPKIVIEGEADIPTNYDMMRRVYSTDGKSPTLRSTSNRSEAIAKITCNPKYYRKLTPLECERLQTFPNGYTVMLSNTQRYKTIGNSWTVDIIKHILSHTLQN